MPLTPLEDQQLGGLLMWVPGEFLNVLALAAIFFIWANKSSSPDPPGQKAPSAGTSAGEEPDPARSPDRPTATV